MLRLNLLGHVSAHTPTLLHIIIKEIFHFGCLILKLMLLEIPPLYFKNGKEVEGIDEVCASFFVFQGLYVEYEDKLIVDYLDEFKEE